MINKPTIILAIETATSSCSVALGVGTVVYQLSEVGNNIHSQVLLEMVQQVLQNAKVDLSDVSAVAVGQGPGSFTGLRIGVGVAQGIAYGACCPMLGISSLAALANQTKFEGYVIAAIDARMNEVYWGGYKNSSNVSDRFGTLQTQIVGEISVTAPTLMTLKHIASSGVDVNTVKVALAGNAWQEYRDKFDQSLFSNSILFEDCIYPQATGILTLAQQSFANGELISPIDFAPEYVRNNVAVKKPI